jgi:hypothetical protein
MDCEARPEQLSQTCRRSVCCLLAKITRCSFVGQPSSRTGTFSLERAKILNRVGNLSLQRLLM